MLCIGKPKGRSKMISNRAKHSEKLFSSLGLLGILGLHPKSTLQAVIASGDHLINFFTNGFPKRHV